MLDTFMLGGEGRKGLAFEGQGSLQISGSMWMSNVIVKIIRILSSF